MTENSHMQPVRDVLREAVVRLESAGVSHAEFEARNLFAFAYGVSLSAVTQAQILGLSCADVGDGDASEQGSAGRYELFLRSLDRRCEREPLQHITGIAPFRFLELAVGKGVFVPRPETELLVDEAVDYVHQLRSTDQSNRPVTIVDLCAGSGALGLACVDEIPNSVVYAVEKDAQAFEYLMANASRVDSADYHPLMSDACAVETLEYLNGSVDIVVSNPPYIPPADVPEQPEVALYDPALALYGGGQDGMDVPRRIIERACALLRSGGLLVMEHDISQGAATCEVARLLGFEQVETRKDLAHKDRFLRAIKP